MPLPSSEVSERASRPIRRLMLPIAVTRGAVRLRRSPLVVGAVALALMLGGSASAATIYFYYSGNLGPSQHAQSVGWNYREHNRVCRNDLGYGLGKAAAADYYSDGSLEGYTGGLYTNCQSGSIARLEEDGYFLVRCWNWDTFTYDIVCQSTKP